MGDRNRAGAAAVGAVILGVVGMGIALAAQAIVEQQAVQERKQRRDDSRRKRRASDARRKKVAITSHAHRSESEFIRTDWHIGECISYNSGGLYILDSKTTYHVLSYLELPEVCTLKQVSSTIKMLSDTLATDKEYIRACASKGFTSYRLGCWKTVLNSVREEFIFGHVFNVIASSGEDAGTRVTRDIAVDVDRTFPDQSFYSHELFNREKLQQVLTVYAIHDSEVGYMQGMNYVVGFLLMNMNEHETFWMFDSLMHEYDLRWMYLPEVPCLNMFLWMFDHFLGMFLPDLARHFKKESVLTSHYSVEWFATVFTYVLPYEHLLRVWDVFIVDGMRVIFQVGLALLLRSQHLLLTMRFEQIIPYLKSFPDKSIIEIEGLLADSRTFLLSDALMEEAETLYLDECVMEFKSSTE